VTVLIENGLPLTALPRLLTDSEYRGQVLAHVQDAQILDFFRTRYEHAGNLNESTLRRAFLLTYPPALRYSLGQQDNLLHFRRLMDQRVSVLISLGGLDTQTQRLLGCLLTVGFEQAALSRADLPPVARSARCSPWYSDRNTRPRCGESAAATASSIAISRCTMRHWTAIQTHQRGRVFRSEYQELQLRADKSLSRRTDMPSGSFMR
jgi:hypothetical protein